MELVDDGFKTIGFVGGNEHLVEDCESRDGLRGEDSEAPGGSDWVDVWEKNLDGLGGSDWVEDGSDDLDIKRDESDLVKDEPDVYSDFVDQETDGCLSRTRTSKVFEDVEKSDEGRSKRVTKSAKDAKVPRKRGRPSKIKNVKIETADIVSEAEASAAASSKTRKKRSKLASKKNEFRCKRCEKEFVDALSLARHTRWRHPDEAKKLRNRGSSDNPSVPSVNAPRTPSVRGLKAREKKHFDYSLANGSNTASKPELPCFLCGTKFWLKCDLRKHLEDNHVDEPIFSPPVRLEVRQLRRTDETRRRRSRRHVDSVLRFVRRVFSGRGRKDETRQRKPSRLDRSNSLSALRQVGI